MGIASLQNRIDALEAKITRAFDAQPIPSGIVTHQCEECERLSADFRSVAWPDLPEAVIEQHSADLPLLSPAAFAYYVPAYLRFALHDFNRDSRVLQFLVYNIAPSDDENPEWKRERFRYFTREQADVLQEFLQLVVEQDELRLFLGTLGEERRRLETHWSERWNG